MKPEPLGNYTMNARRSKDVQHEQVCELLAYECQVPLDDVKRLYEDEWQRLAIGARMTGFLGILTLRNVRTTLRRKSQGEITGAVGALRQRRGPRSAARCTPNKRVGPMVNRSGCSKTAPAQQEELRQPVGSCDSPGSLFFGAFMRPLRGLPKPRAQISNATPSRMDWSDEKLAQLDVEQLKNLLENLNSQLAIGRVSADSAQDLSQRIAARLPVRAQNPRRMRPRALIELDGRVAKDLGDFAAHLSRQYDLTDETARKKSIDVVGFRPQAGTDKHGRAREGTAVKKGSMAIARSISYRVGESMASLAFLLLPGKSHETGRYVILATDDLLTAGVPMIDVIPEPRDFGWSHDSRGRMRAQPAQNFAEAQALYEALIAVVATKRAEDEQQGEPLRPADRSSA